MSKSHNEDNNISEKNKLQNKENVYIYLFDSLI